jgi:hypothetical protein
MTSSLRAVLTMSHLLASRITGSGSPLGSRTFCKCKDDRRSQSLLALKPGWRCCQRRV